MKGRVLGYDPAAEAVVISGEDGRRYRFAAGDWREPRPPRKGDAVDFETSGDRGREVFLADAVARAPASEAPIVAFARVPGMRLLLDRPGLVFALLLLLACLPGAYLVADERLALIAVPDLIARLTTALDSIVAASGGEPNSQVGAAATRIAMVLLFLLYAVPVLTGLAFWREFVGRPDGRMARLAGLSAMILPIALPLIVVAMVHLLVVPAGGTPPTRLGRNGLTSPGDIFAPLTLFASGVVYLFVAGAGLWAAGAGRLKSPLAAAQPHERDVTERAAGAGSPNGARDYAPLRQPKPVATEPSSRATETPQPQERTAHEPSATRHERAAASPQEGTTAPPQERTVAPPQERAAAPQERATAPSRPFERATRTPPPPVTGDAPPAAGPARSPAGPAVAPVHQSAAEPPERPDAPAAPAEDAGAGRPARPFGTPPQDQQAGTLRRTPATPAARPAEGARIRREGGEAEPSPEPRPGADGDEVPRAGTRGFPAQSPQDETALSALADEIRAVIDRDATGSGGPATTSASTEPHGERSRRVQSRGELPPLSRSIWPRDADSSAVGTATEGAVDGNDDEGEGERRE